MDLRDARSAWINEAEKAPPELRRRQETDFLERVTATGQIDFHSLRHAYVSRLIDQGMTARETQELARHSTPMLTIGTYTHAEAAKFSAKIQSAMPDLSSERMRIALRLSGVVSTKDGEKHGRASKGAAGKNAEKAWFSKDLE